DSAAIISDLLTNDKGEIVFYIFTKLICIENNTYIGFEIPSKSINDIMLENNPYNGLGNSGEVYLAGEDRLMRSQSRFVENSVLKIQVPNSNPNNIDQNNFVAETTLDYRGIKVLSSSGIIEWGNTKWTIFAEIDYKEALIPVNTLRDSIIFIGLLGIILFTSIVMILIITITKPVAKLKKAADEISGGNYNVNVPVNNTDEIGQLSDTFNQMVQKIDEQKKRLDYEKLNRVQEMIDWQETERQRLSRELHDGIGQLLLSAKMRLGRIKGKTENDERIINDSQNIIQQTVNDVRNISNNLMPSVLSEFGLKQAVENILKDISQNYKIATSCDINLTSLDDNKTITYLYRIIQEAVSNTLKYAKSKSINITITEEENLIKLEIRDDGIGFNPNQVIGSGSNGLRNIRERVKLLNGKCSIKSSQGNGTVIYIEIIK
ncbi:MAG TPA: HAMP domain-containing protein, partial [Bacteroidales bacterium]|nr:HAMP domain-containing protein [Bacteroidales bacterium]